LANAVVGSNKVAITRDSIVLPSGIQLKQVGPQVLEVNLVLQVQKQLPIQPDWTGKLPAGLILQEAHTIPASVKVVGGSLALKDTQTIYTEKIPLENITTDGKVSVGLVLLPSYLKLEDTSQNHFLEVCKTIFLSRA